MMRLGRVGVTLALFAVLATAPHAQATSAGHVQQAATGAPNIAVALHGDIYVLRADGSARYRLTTSGRASAPRLSPDGRLVAYFEAAPGQPAQSGNPAGAIYILPVGAPTGTAGQRIDADPIARDDARLSWSPDSSRLAYFCGTTPASPGGSSVVIHVVHDHGADILLHAPRGAAYAGDVAWSPDGRRIAVPLVQPAAQAIPQTLRIAIGAPPNAHWTQITVRFPPGALGMRAGKFPVSAPANDPVWTPDGRGFLFSTTLVGEGPPAITGIWRVGADGGMARLAIGTAWGVRHGLLPANDPLRQATHFLLSPDRTLLATDPLHGLWVATPDGGHGRFLPVHVSRFCALAQYSWLRDSSGLAYVQLCPTTGPNALAQATLFSVQMDGSAPRQLYRATSSNQQVIDLAPTYRCVLCGY